MTLPSPLEIGAIGSALLVGAGLVFFFLKAFEMSMLLGAAGGALIVVAGLLSQYVQMGDDRRAAVDKPIVDQCAALDHKAPADCAAFLDGTVDQNKALVAGMAELSHKVDTMTAEEAQQNQAVADFVGQSKKALADAQIAMAGNARKVAALESDTNMVFRNAAGALMNLTCDQREKKYGDFVHSIAVREYTDRPPKDAPNKPGVSVK